MLVTLIRSWKNFIGLILGPFLFACIALTNPPVAELSYNAWLIVGLVVWMAVWWISEPVPIPVTALLPIIAIPLLGIDSTSAAAAPYANPLIYLFLGGFTLSIAMEKWNLHKRIALLCLLAAGRKPSHQLAGLMFVSAFLSMWMSNTATAVMMLPIALSIIELRRDQKQKKNGFGKAVLLGIAYAASIGGVATLIGSPPNALLAGYLANNYNITLGFSEWMMIGLPLSIVMLVASWLLLTKVLFTVDGSEDITDIKKTFRKELRGLGKLTRAEKIIGAIFLLAAFGWIFRPIINSTLGIELADTTIALLAAFLLFILPVRVSNYTHILNWEDTQKLPWGVLLLFGGGLSLADQIQKTGVADFIASQFASVGSVNLLILTLVLTGVIIFLTEITSNTATAAGFIPLLGPIALSLNLGLAPLLVPAVIATSFAFMMPVATPPNSIVFASGELKIVDMMRAGFLLNILSIILITATAMLLVPYVLTF